jgi:hypothetical protein
MTIHRLLVGATGFDEMLAEAGWSFSARATTASQVWVVPSVSSP